MLKDQQSVNQVASSTILSAEYQQIFKQCNASATKVSQLVSGVKLARVINKIFYDNTNPVLSNQIITQNEQRKGNNVINMNMVLKQVKNNSKFPCPQQIAELTTFRLIDNEEEMLKFVKWIYDSWKQAPMVKGTKNRNTGLVVEESKENMQRNAGTETGNENQNTFVRNKKVMDHRIALRPHKDREEKDFGHLEMEPMDQNEQKQENIFQNVFFCDRDISPDKINIPLNDSLDLSEKVSKKGSFKIIRPKTVFQQGNKEASRGEQQKMEQIDSPFKQKQSTSFKDKVVETQVHQRYYSDQKKSETRKTIPKMAERPPLYKKINKEQTKTQNQYKGNDEQQNMVAPAPFAPDNSHQGTGSKASNLLREINKIQDEIKRQNEQKSKITTSNSRSVEASRTKSNRKLFKVDIKQVDEAQRKSIVEWLISINLLNSMATNYYDKFHQICKNGVIFPEIVNHHLGRMGQIGYFKNPVKSAEIHSNYQKVFTYLKDLPSFESELLFMYDFFVPEVIENAFWSLLRSCQQCFQRNLPKKGKNQKVYTRDSEIKHKLTQKSQTENNSRIKTERNESIKKQTDSGEYHKIRYGTTNSFKTISSKTQELKNETPKMSSLQKQQKNKRKASLDFIKELPEKINTVKLEQLVQVEEPIQMNKVSKGYKQLHELKKSHNTSSFIHTPRKKTDNSMSRSRIASTNSVKKLQEKPQLPSITLQMQMKALKYLKQKGHLNANLMDPLPLFEDPIRNGTLVNKIVNQQLKLTYKYSQRPRNIVDCKQNFTKCFAQLKECFVSVPYCYEFYYQNIIKGEMTLFYGLIWHIIGLSPYKNLIGSNGLKNQSAILSMSKNYMNPELQASQKLTEQILFWIRELEQQNPQIAQAKVRDINNIQTSIINSNLLYKMATTIIPEKYTLKPTYEHPVNAMEQESNLKKILSFYSHNKILRSELAWKAKSLVKRDKATTLQILKQLMNYSKNSKKVSVNFQNENPIVSFVKFARQNSREDMKNYERTNERLETTMANNSLAAVQVKKQLIKKSQQVSPPIEVPWMRTLGFQGDLSLNSGVILCRLVSKLMMKTLTFNENPTSKAECLTNIRKALKQIDKFKWNQEDIASVDEKTTQQIYKFLKDKYRHCYALKSIRP